MIGILQGLVAGAIGGAAATASHSAVMLTAQRAGLIGKLPPKLIAEAGLDAAGVHPPEAATNLLSTAAHVAYGLGAGPVYGVWRRLMPLPVPGPVQGLMFGLGMWALNYGGITPGLGIMPPPDEDDPGRVATMVAAHCAYGLTLGTIVG